jgi:hypothetical protein
MKLFEKTIDAIHKGVAFIQAGLLGLLLAMVV